MKYSWKGHEEYPPLHTHPRTKLFSYRFGNKRQKRSFVKKHLNLKSQNRNYTHFVFMNDWYNIQKKVTRTCLYVL